MHVVEWFPPLFADRAAAGRALADALATLRRTKPVVVGVARGGVAVASEVAGELAAPLTAVDVERVVVHGRRVGAATTDGPPLIERPPGIPDAEVEAALARARRAAEALERRLEAARIPLAGRTAVVVDDGLVTGLTLAAACRWARMHEPSRLVAATPVGRPDGLHRVRAEADAVVCPHVVEQLAVVGQAYDVFDTLDEWYVSTLLAGPPIGRGGEPGD